jgi:hypothetical protein
MLFSDHGSATLEGGPGRLVYRSTDSKGTLDTDTDSIRYTGGW